MPRRTIAALALVTLLVTPGLAQLRVAPVGERPDRAALELLLRKLSSSGTFMETDAHPDDEDNGLLAKLGYGEGMRTTLVTATRGDGGQNEIGPELGTSLGVLRTEELLAVHRFDGAEQYFTRTIDFGYSFSIDESIEKWGHDEIVGDLVRHIRTIRPDVIAGFLCGGQSGGLHHQASARLTLEAFRAAGDPTKYPEQISAGLRPWQAARYFCTDENSFAPQPPPRTPDMVSPDTSGFDSALGRTYAEVAVEARSMHKCQGTSQLLLLPGQSQSRTYRLQDDSYAATHLNVDAAPPAPTPVASLFEGIDTSIVGLMRLAGQREEPSLRTALVALQQSVVDAHAALAARGPAAAITPLAAGLRATRALRVDLPRLLGVPGGDVPAGTGAGASDMGGAMTPAPSTIRDEIDFRLAQKERQFQDALLIAAGVQLDALADDGTVTPGQAVSVTVYAAAPGYPICQLCADTADATAPVLRAATLSGFDGQPLPSCAGPLGTAITCKAAATVPVDTHLSTPYWTPRTDSARYDFEPDVPFGVPFRPSPFRVRFELTIGSAPVTVERVVQFRYSNLVAGEKRSELNVSPAFDVRVDPGIAIFPVRNLRAGAATDATAAGSSRKTISVTVASNQKGPATATVDLQVPGGWQVQPASAPVAFAKEDDETTVHFTLEPPAGLAAGEFQIRALVSGQNGARSDAGYQVVEYPHIHRRHVVEAAAVRVKAMDVAIAPGLKVGYIMGVGDRVPEAIAQLGAEVTMLDANALASGDLSRFNTIVVGVRAYERRQDLRANNQRLLAYAENGGTVIVQYQRTEFNEAQYGPYPAKTSSDRVTDENAPMEILKPDNPIFTTPNAIGPETWSGWIQERGTYFMGARDPRYVDLLESGDPFPYNPGTKTGILVEATVGQGRWIYTGLGLWRQLPAGVEGAYRLMANLLSLGKKN